MPDAQDAMLVVLTLCVVALFFRVRSLEAKVTRLLGNAGRLPAFAPAPAIAPPTGMSAVAAAASLRPVMNVPAASAPSPVATANIPMAEIEALIRDGQLIGAIKLWREKTGVGLKDAKDAVEAVRDEMKRRG